MPSISISRTLTAIPDSASFPLAASVATDTSSCPLPLRSASAIDVFVLAALLLPSGLQRFASFAVGLSAACSPSLAAMVAAGLRPCTETAADIYHGFMRSELILAQRPDGGRGRSELGVGVVVTRSQGQSDIARKLHTPQRN